MESNLITIIREYSVYYTFGYDWNCVCVSLEKNHQKANAVVDSETTELTCKKRIKSGR